jgi:hypothetical protein
MHESQRLWWVWWLWGVPVAWTASALVIAADTTRTAGYHNTGAILDIARLALYWWWMRLAWKCSGNVNNRIWTVLSRVLLSLGLVANYLA